MRMEVIIRLIRRSIGGSALQLKRLVLIAFIITCASIGCKEEYLGYPTSCCSIPEMFSGFGKLTTKEGWLFDATSTCPTMYGVLYGHYSDYIWSFEDIYVYAKEKGIGVLAWDVPSWHLEFNTISITPAGEDVYYVSYSIYMESFVFKSCSRLNGEEVEELYSRIQEIIDDYSDACSAEESATAQVWTSKDRVKLNRESNKGQISAMVRWIGEDHYTVIPKPGCEASNELYSILFKEIVLSIRWNVIENYTESELPTKEEYERRVEEEGSE